MIEVTVMTNLTVQDEMGLFEIEEQIKAQHELLEQRKELRSRVWAEESKYIVYAIQINKGAAINKRVMNVITPQKLGSNLRHFMSQQNRFFDEVRVSEVPQIARHFRGYWVSKLDPDDKLYAAVTSDVGLQSITNYIGAEVLRERHALGRVSCPQVAHALAWGAAAREARQFSHEAIQKGFRDAGKAMQEDLRKQGIRLDARQLGAFDGILKLNIANAIDKIEQKTADRFDQLEHTINRVISQQAALQIEDNSGQEDH